MQPEPARSRDVGGRYYHPLMQLPDLILALIAAVGVAFAAIAVRKAANLLWLITTWVARGIWGLLVGWWFARFRAYVDYGF